MVKQVGEGLHYAVTTPDICLAVITMAVIGTFGFNFQVFTPLIAQFVLHTSAVGYGLLTSCMAVGSLVSALGVAWLGRATRRVLLIGAACFSMVLLAIGLSSTWLMLAPLFVMLGVFSSIFTATNSARLQLITPAPLRGRVMSIQTLLFAGSTPIGSFIAGTAAALLYLRRTRARLIPPGEELISASLAPRERELMPAAAR